MKKEIHYHSNVLYLTDSEGTASFFETINKSTIVACDSNFKLSFKANKAEPYLVFGGDSIGRGNYDMRIVEALLQLKEENPDNVILMAGNREISYSRINYELLAELIKQRLLESASPRWLPKDKPTVPKDYVIKRMQQQEIMDLSPESIRSFVMSLSIEECQLIYLKWMLEKTMGCPYTFRYRREELSLLLNREVSDKEVLESFKKEAKPDGLVGQYLQKSQIIARIPNSGILVVHGGLTAENIGRVPGTQEYFDKVDDWVEHSNQWYKQQIVKWINFHPSELTIPACTELDETVLPIAGKPKSMITADFLGKNREFTEIDVKVSSYLTRNKVNTVPLGHQPSGDMQATVRNENNNLLVINADTGYANSDPKNPDNTRGDTWNTLELLVWPDETHCIMKAKLSNNLEVTNHLRVTPNSIIGDDYIGRITQDGGLVQTKMNDGKYRVIFQQGFDVKYELYELQEMEALFTNNENSNRC